MAKTRIAAATKPAAEVKGKAKPKAKAKAERGGRAGKKTKKGTRASGALQAEIAGRLRTDEDAALYLAAVLHEGNPLLLAAALREVVRVRGLAAVARITGVGKGSLRRSLAAGEPALEAALDLVRALAPRR
jgi:probable addiction module antidote protein